MHREVSFRHVQDGVAVDGWERGDVFSIEKWDSPGFGNGLKW